MNGQQLYGMYESSGARLLIPWEHLGNEERSRWERIAEEVLMMFEGDNEY